MTFLSLKKVKSTLLTIITFLTQASIKIASVVQQILVLKAIKMKILMITMDSITNSLILTILMTLIYYLMDPMLRIFTVWTSVLCPFTLSPNLAQRVNHFKWNQKEGLFHFWLCKKWDRRCCKKKLKLAAEVCSNILKEFETNHSNNCKRRSLINSWKRFNLSQITQKVLSELMLSN